MRTKLVALLALFAVVPRPARADEPADAGRGTSGLLEGHLRLLAKQGRGAPPAESVDELDALLERAYRYESQGRRDEATRLLLEAVEGPRFRSFESLPSFEAAERTLASLLIAQRALTTAERAVDRLLARGPDSGSFASAVRLAVDIALARGDHAASARALAGKLPARLPEDAASELGYLRGLAADDAGDVAEARRALGAVTTKSRLYPSAAYLLGAIAARERDFAEARRRFCAVRRVRRDGLRAGYASGPLFETEELATLGLARIDHEEGHREAAFDHYFQVPTDSPRLAEALFESAYASYERGRNELAEDSLKELAARYPHSPLTAEAEVLRGYVDLARCDFARAEASLKRFEQTFGEVLRELEATLASSGRTRDLFGARATPDARATGGEAMLRGLVRRDPEVERLRAARAALEGELDRGASVSRELGLLAERLRKGEAPRARPADLDAPSDEVRRATLARRLADARAALTALRRELTALRRVDPKRAELPALRKIEVGLSGRCDRIEAALRAAGPALGTPAPQPSAETLSVRLTQDAAYVKDVRARAARVRSELDARLAAAERRALETLRARIEKELRRARIGRIDAVMGAKRQLELQVESLAAGRFPPELRGRRVRPALLRDDEEYWPFEGEAWADERAEAEE